MARARKFDPFSARDTFATSFGPIGIYRLSRLEQAGLGKIAALPYSIRLLLEAALRNCDGFQVTEQDVKNLAASGDSSASVEIPFKPARVVLQDFTGVPAVVDLAAMRSAMQRLGGDPKRINPLVPADLVIDHSVQVDRFGSSAALAENMDYEFQRNRERYEFLRWGQKAMDNLRVIPPGVGIIHQVNLEYLAKVVFQRNDERGPVGVPDTLVGTDSHTTMINGLGVLGWGVGGIEAEAVMLGQPLYMLLPEVIGFELTGRLAPGATATDLVLTVTQILRKEGVVGKFVEYFGAGVSAMALADRATIANMSPEYGATMGFFPVDGQTLRYLRETGRTDQEVELVERYTKEQQLWRADDAPTPTYSRVLRLDLGTVEPSLAGPKRPQDRVPLKSVKRSFHDTLRAPVNQRGFGLAETETTRTAQMVADGQSSTMGHGAVVIASITSCTNTSNPTVMLEAGLLAKKAVEKGLRTKPHVKTSLAPGSRVVADYYQATGLDRYLDQLGFQIVGYGCMTCIGNSGPLPDPVAKAIHEGNLVAAAVLSGNRNFEGRIQALVKANYLASPPLVVAYALAGTMDLDLATEPLGTGSDGKPVYLKDIWPTAQEVQRCLESIRPEMFRQRYGNVQDVSPLWAEMAVPEGEIYAWDAKSTYIQEPPFLANLTPEPSPIHPIAKARVLAALGDSVTTDHISPAGSIATSGPAGRYLREHGVEPQDFNSYGSRRGNDRVMTRGTFANIRIRNLLVPGVEGGVTRHMPSGEQMTIYEAAVRYKAEGVPLVVLAGAEYGTGSSRDWAAKGTYLLGVRAVIASSFERIHRSNLVGMGVLPLELPQGQTWQSIGLTGEETFEILGLAELRPGDQLTVRACPATGKMIEFKARARIDTPVELEYYRHGGILPMMVRKLLSGE
jgi:aconitate hydratase